MDTITIDGPDGKKEVSLSLRLFTPEELSPFTIGIYDKNKSFIDLIKYFCAKENVKYFPLPHCGLYYKGLFVCKETNVGRKVVFFGNPSYSPASADEAKVPCKEECIVCGSVSNPIERYDSITVTYTSEEGKEVTHRVYGKEALEMQHAIDHATGELKHRVIKARTQCA